MAVVQRLKDRARLLKRETIALYLVARDPRTPWYARVLDLWADDDALTESATSVPVDATKPLPPVTVTISKYRGLGDVVFGDEHPKMETLKGGKPEEPYSGKASTTVKFGQPGDYMLHVIVNDYSGFGGGSNCCWTNAIVKVGVAGASQTETSPP